MSIEINYWFKIKNLTIKSTFVKKILTTLLLSLLICNISFAESYYFKACKLSNAVVGNYVINFDKNVIEVNLQALDGKIQNFSDKIQSIKKDKIISEKIRSGKGKNIYYQYFLDSKSQSVIKLQFRKESGIDMDVFKLDRKKESYCSDVKTDWDKLKIEKAEIDKEQEQILKAQEQIKKEQSLVIKCQGNDYKQWTNCQGIYNAESGHKYNGLFKDGRIIKGTSIFPGGAKYVGEFKDYKPHGYGTFVWSNGDKYYGEWKDGKNHGNGTKIWKDGRKYLGTFQNDKLHGKGTLFYPDGKKYVGEFINGKRHGEGTFTYSDGTAYIGKFISGKEEGVGECIGKDGSSIKCANKSDTQIQDFSGKDIRNISIVAKKWVRISQYETNSKKGKKIMEKLETDFKTKAFELCAQKGNVKILEKKIEVLDIDDTPAYGLETVVKLGISGTIECK